MCTGNRLERGVRLLAYGSLAGAAARWVLQQPAVAGAIVGARITERQHSHQNKTLLAKVFLFDVSNPQAPVEVQSIEIGQRGTQAIALQDHHGITIQSASETHPARLAFGIDVHDIPTSNSGGPAQWYAWRETGLFTFEIQTGTNAGISQPGRMIVEARSDEQPWGPLRYNDRSVIVDDAVFYIHGEQVFSANWNSMGNFSGPK